MERLLKCITLRGVGTDRAETGGAANVQSGEEKVSERDWLLGAADRNGRSGPRAVAAIAFRDAAQLKTEVAVVGFQTYLEVRNLEKYGKEIEEQTFNEQDLDTLNDLGI